MKKFVECNYYDKGSLTCDCNGVIPGINKVCKNYAADYGLIGMCASGGLVKQDKASEIKRKLLFKVSEEKLTIVERAFILIGIVTSIISLCKIIKSLIVAIIKIERNSKYD